MADNYLEKKMEEHLSHRPSTAPAPRRDQGLHYPLKPLRILIVARNRRHLNQYVAPLTTHRHRITIINTLPAPQTDLPHNHGTRYYPLPQPTPDQPQPTPDTPQNDTTATSPNTTTGTPQIDRILTSLIQAWRDIDAVIMLDPTPAIATHIAHHAATRPYPNDWGTPTILVTDHTLTRLTPTALTETAETTDHPTSLTDIPNHPAAAHIPYLLLRTSSTIHQITLL